MYKPAVVIDSFSGEYAFLSNFHASPIRLPATKANRLALPQVARETNLANVEFATVEHAFQAMKATNVEDFMHVVEAHSPGVAKRIARAMPRRKDWEAVKIDVMAACLSAKFSTYPKLAAQLLATGDAVLIEGNTWGDSFWGQCPVGTGHNALGLLLMALRGKYRLQNVRRTAMKADRLKRRAA